MELQEYIAMQNESQKWKDRYFEQKERAEKAERERDSLLAYLVQPADDTRFPWTHYNRSGTGYAHRTREEAEQAVLRAAGATP